MSSSYFVDPSRCARHTIFPGVEIATTCTDRLMLSVVEFQPHAVVEEHSHPHDQMGLLLEGELDFTIGGQRQTLRPGQMWRIPGGVKHKAVAGAAGAKALDVFHPVRDEYR
jgi:quercetin dioxygenase-like cupin family protein